MKHSTKRVLYFISLTAILLHGCGGGGKSDKNNMDTQKPQITLQGDKTLFLNIGESFIDPGATAFDNVDGDITSKIGIQSPSIDTSVPGEYEIIYSVQDKAGHIDTAKRKVFVMNMTSNPESHKESGIVINEVLALNSHTTVDPDFKQFSDYIELFNNTDSAQNIGGYYLSDDPVNPKKWKIPSATLDAKQRLLIWADKEDTDLHTNFSLDSDGETLILSDRNGQEIDRITFQKQKRDISVTRLGEKNYYMIPTPGTKNKHALDILQKSKKPDFDKESGFYTGAQQVSLSQENGGTIYYTTDGSIPTLESAIFSASNPITISKTTVIRARAIENGKFLSSTVNHTFLIDEEVHLPVVSIGIDKKYFDADNDIAIYTNYEEEGWRRPASIEYIGKDYEEKFSENIAVAIFGGFSRKYSKKSLAVFARNQYGAKSIDYPLFPNKPFIKKSRSFVLRSGGNAWKTVFFKDAVVQSLVKDQMDIDYQDYQPIILFINGEYWGISNIREKLNKDYLEANYNITDPVEILEKNGEDSVDYQALLTNSVDYNYAKSHMDINNYLNYYVTEIYIGNQDWPKHNIKYWKEKKPFAKWRWFLYDLDFAFYNAQSDDISYATATIEAPLHKNPAWSAVLFNNLLKSDDFKYRFLGKFITHMHLTFEPQRLLDKIDALEAIVRPDMPRDIKRWKYAPKRKIHSIYSWESQLAKFKTKVQERPPYILEHIRAFFNLSQTYSFTVMKPDNGTIFIDEAPVNQNYNADYFANSIVTLKAIPNSGYRFVRWSDGSTRQKRDITFNSAKTLSAIFQVARIPKIVINEINYKSNKNHDSGDWIELYNNDSFSINLSGWKLKDASLSKGYVIPAGTILRPGSYLVIARDKRAFTAAYNTQTPVLGNFQFGLSKVEDTIKLYNEQEALVDQVHYDKTWPDANGNGKTLALIDPNSDNSLSANWVAADNFGTPGTQN